MTYFRSCQLILAILILAPEVALTQTSDAETAELLLEEMCNSRQFQDFRGSSGTVQSPGYPQRYRNNRKQCTLIGVEGQDSELIFNTFNLELGDDHGGCPYDFLSIYTLDGSRLHGPLCGNLLPEPIQFEGEVMVYFESDLYDRKPGFSAEYGPAGIIENRNACTVIQDGSGVITSPDFNTGGRYPNNYYECWVLGNVDMSINIDIRRLLVEGVSSCLYDSLVFSSLLDDGQYHQEVRLCGTNQPDDLHFPHGPIKVEFTTDASIRKRGFKFQYNLNLNPTDVDAECIPLVESNGEISVAAGEYENGLSVCWFLSASLGQIIHIEGPRLDAQGQIELIISDAAGSRRISHGGEIPGPFMSSAGYVEITLTSNNTVTLERFNLVYHVGQTDCQILTVEEMTGLTSVNYPNGYMPNVYECWTILPPSGEPVYIHFTDVQMQNTFQCRNDFVAIFDGLIEYGTELERICAPDILPVPPALSGMMTVVFSSNEDTIVGSGIEFEFTTSPDGVSNGNSNSNGDGNENSNGNESGNGNGNGNETEEVPNVTSANPACRGQPTELSGNSGTIRFLDETITVVYENNMSCKWNITVSPGKRIKFTFSYMDIEDHQTCYYDGVMVREQDTSIGVTCGAEGHDIVSWENSVILEFYSDASERRRGFIVDYTAITYNVVEVDNAPPLCGVVSQQRNHLASTRIVGGVEALPYDWPWQVSLLIDGAHNCGGSIISDTWILTAAHCVYGNTDPTSYAVVASQHDLRVFEGFEIVYRVAEVVIHEDYNTTTVNNDIALLRLEMPIKWNQHVVPVCLPTQEAVVDGMCYTTGWGDTQDTGDANVLNEVDVSIVATSEANRPWAYNGDITPQMVTAGHDQGGKDSCQGDSGGPLVCKRSATAPWSQAGVTSWGYGCAVAATPGVYARVEVFVDWVQQKTSNAAQTTQ